MLRDREGGVQGLPGQRLAKKDRRRAQDAAADLAAGILLAGVEPRLDRPAVVHTATGDATDAMAGAVELDHAVGLVASLLVQAIDVLGHHSEELPGPFEAGESTVAVVRLASQHRRIGASTLLPELEAGFPVGTDGVDVRDLAGLPDAIRAAVVRDAGLRADAGASEGGHTATVADHPLGLVERSWIGLDTGCGVVVLVCRCHGSPLSQSSEARVVPLVRP